MRFLLLSILLLVFQGHAYGMGAKPAGVLLTDPNSKIQLAGDLTDSEQTMLLDDLAYFAQQNLEDDASINSLFHLGRTTTNGMLSWLSDRIQFIVAKQKDITSGSTESSVVMANLGASLYWQAKRARTPMPFQVANGPSLAVSSPRVGIIEAGPGLFRGPFANAEVDASAASSRIYRLGTLFHEARHSDGNAGSLAFFHGQCPAGHIYENQYACDQNLNGPYTIGGKAFLAMEKACQNCSEQDREILRLSALDSFSRIVRPTVEAMQADECAFVATIANNQLVPTIIPDKCRSNSGQLAPVNNGTSNVWDESPEYLNRS